MVFQEDACIARLDAWIIEIKKNVYEKNINSETVETPENVERLFAYKSYLEGLQDKISRAIKDEHKEALYALGWPDELMECIKDMTLRVEILDHLEQAFKINHFNKSPEHERELQKAKQW